MESIEFMMAEIFEEACVNLSNTEVPSAFTLLLTSVKRVMVLFRYWILKAAFRILFKVKLKVLAVIVEEGWIYTWLANPNTLHFRPVAKLHNA